MNIVLTGFMGTGKSFIGKAIARKLAWDYYDTDEMIEKQVGMSVADIFAKKGEPHFRDLETKTVKLLSVIDKVIIATGGGIVLRKENMDELMKKGVVVCLTATPQKILERTKTNKSRPLLNVKDPVARIQELLDSRKEYYSRSHLIVDTTDLTPDQSADKILAFPLIADKISGGELK